jgi:hypothetical protein
LSLKFAQVINHEEKNIVSFSYQCDYETLGAPGTTDMIKGNVYLYADFKYGTD